MAGVSAGAAGCANRRCSQCGRALPGRLDRIPRWPVYLALAGSLVYPVLRVTWVLGGTIGTTGGESEVDPALAWSLIALSSLLVAFTGVLLFDRGPAWLRAVLGFGGLLAGATLAMVGGMGLAMAIQILFSQGPDYSPGADLSIWTFIAVYGSWFVTGIGVMAGSWRYWAHRRVDCPTCSRLLE